MAHIDDACVGPGLVRICPYRIVATVGGTSGASSQRAAAEPGFDFEAARARRLFPLRMPDRMRTRFLDERAWPGPLTLVPHIRVPPQRSRRSTRAGGRTSRAPRSGPQAARPELQRPGHGRTDRRSCDKAQPTPTQHSRATLAAMARRNGASQRMLRHPRLQGPRHVFIIFGSCRRRSAPIGHPRATMSSALQELLAVSSELRRHEDLACQE